MRRYALPSRPDPSVSQDTIGEQILKRLSSTDGADMEYCMLTKSLGPEFILGCALEWVDVIEAFQGSPWLTKRWIADFQECTRSLRISSRCSPVFQDFVDKMRDQNNPHLTEELARDAIQNMDATATVTAPAHSQDGECSREDPLQHSQVVNSRNFQKPVATDSMVTEGGDDFKPNASATSSNRMQLWRQERYWDENVSGRNSEASKRVSKQQ